MARGLEPSVKLPFDGRHVDDVFFAAGRAQHQRFEARVDEERCDGIHQLHFEQFDTRHFIHLQPPAVAFTQIHLLHVLIQPTDREERLLRVVLLLEQPDLRELRGVCESDSVPEIRRRQWFGTLSLRQHVVAAHTFVGAQQASHRFRHDVERRVFDVHHVLIKIRRAAHRLTGIVDDEIETITRGDEVTAKGLDTRGVPQIEPENFEPFCPLGKIGFGGVARGRVAWKSRGDDEVGAGTQQLDAGLEADLHAPTCEQRHATAQIGGLGALGVVEACARRTQLIVEVMQCGVVLLAHVAVERFRRVEQLRFLIHRVLHEIRRSEESRCDEHVFATKFADAGVLQDGLGALCALGFALVAGCFHQTSSRERIGT